MKPKVIVTGASGMLGKDFSKTLKKGFYVIPLSRSELDITNFDNVMRAFEKSCPDIVVNCAAFTKVDLCEEKRKEAFLVNAKGPENLIKACNSINAKLVHISTDYVFDGMAERPYKENDQTNPINVYGQSKLEGERAIITKGKNYLIIRTSWLFGKGGPNFIKTMLDLARKQKRLQVVQDQTGRPTYTIDLVEYVSLLINCNAKGIVHCANSGSCTWFDLCSFALEKAGMRDAKVLPVTSDKFKRPARRPIYSVLDLERFKSITGKTPRHWNKAVLSYLEEIGSLCPGTQTSYA